MADKESDDRFSKVFTDPRFRTLRKRDKTLKIDKRFQSMFTEDKFKLKYSMDKRGRSRKHLMAEDYKKFYRLSDDEKEEEDECEKKEKGEEKSSDHESDEEVEEEEDEVKLTHKFGYHRGVGFDEDEESSSSSSESEEEEEDGAEEEEVEHDWGELDREAPSIENATERLAICNADWDRINAQDLYVLLNSFKKATGTIHSVRIYYSKFGEERMQVEEKKGPSEFIFGESEVVETLQDDEVHSEDGATGRMEKVKNLDELYKDYDEEEEEEDEESDPKAAERLRKYQLERLKYFYAVVECDSAQTAEVIYQELDGMEYEASSTLLDIRFVPDDMNFDDVRLKEECTSMPNSATYKPPAFINTALQQSKVRLTWDETDPRRKEAFNRAFEENNEDDIQAYLATSSDDDDQEQSEVEIDDQMEESDKINKYKNLLKSLDQNKDEEYEMEVTWDPNLRSNAEELINKKDSTTAEARQSKSKTNKLTKELVESEEEEEDLENDVSEVDNDEQLCDEDQLSDLVPEETLVDTKETKSKRKKWKNKKKKVNQFESEDTSNLELLMMDIDKSGENKKHFNYKDIVDKYNKKTDGDEDKDGFKFDADDPRFNSIYTSHLYNVDQSDPNFKRTKAFDQILNKRKEKAARLVNDESAEVGQGSQSTGATTKTKTWNTLVRKVKDKTTEQLATKRPAPRIFVNPRFDTNKKFRR